MVTSAFAPIQGGWFSMGTERGQEDERPPHRVFVDSFELGVFPVTRAQYESFVEATGHELPRDWSHPPFAQPDLPVVGVSWLDAVAYCAWRSTDHGRPIRLPTEAEWEFAARDGGKDQTYPWGEGAPTCERAVLKDCGSGTAPVCSTPLGNTKQGLCDMAGNVWEWVEDSYHETYQGAPSDGSAWTAPASAYRVLRGGSFFYDGAKLKAAGRGFGDPDYRRGDFGFRLARPGK